MSEQQKPMMGEFEALCLAEHHVKEALAAIGVAWQLADGQKRVKLADAVNLLERAKGKIGKAREVRAERGAS